MKKHLAGLAVLAFALTACGSAGQDATGRAVPAAAALDAHKGEVVIDFWHSMKGKNGEALDLLVKQFNDAHKGKARIKALYQGEYDDVVAKYKASVQQKATPALIQIYDIGTRFMIDSKQTMPVQALADKDGFPLGDIDPNISSYYTVPGSDGKPTLHSMPFNTSMPLLYINQDAFKKAGLDPAKPPATLDELTEVAKKLTVKDGSGKTVQYGFGAAIYGWFLEQFVARSDAQYCDKDNGRTDRADKVLLGEPDAVKVAQWWADLVRGGYAVNTGRKTDDAQAAFKSGRVAMNLESTGALRSYLTAAEGKFGVGTAPYPGLVPGGGGPIGGGSLWINAVGHDDPEVRAAWEFVKSVSTPAAQAQWHTGTGYFPVNRKALDEKLDKDWVAKYPQFQVAIDQLHATKPSVATSGCLLGVMPLTRKAAEEGLERSLLGTQSPEAAMKQAADSMKEAIEKYNRAAK